MQEAEAIPGSQEATLLQLKLPGMMWQRLICTNRDTLSNSVTLTTLQVNILTLRMGHVTRLHKTSQIPKSVADLFRGIGSCRSMELITNPAVAREKLRNNMLSNDGVSPTKLLPANAIIHPDKSTRTPGHDWWAAIARRCSSYSLEASVRSIAGFHPDAASPLTIVIISNGCRSRSLARLFTFTWGFFLSSLATYSISSFRTTALVPDWLVWCLRRGGRTGDEANGSSSSWLWW